MDLQSSRRYAGRVIRMVVAQLDFGQTVLAGALNALFPAALVTAAAGLLVKWFEGGPRSAASRPRRGRPSGADASASMWREARGLRAFLSAMVRAVEEDDPTEVGRLKDVARDARQNRERSFRTRLGYEVLQERRSRPCTSTTSTC